MIEFQVARVVEYTGAALALGPVLLEQKLPSSRVRRVLVLWLFDTLSYQEKGNRLVPVTKRKQHSSPRPVKQGRGARASRPNKIVVTNREF